MGLEIIAEVSTNHGGSITLAEDFIHAFADAGADTIKFQLTRYRHLSPKDSQFEWFKQAELSQQRFDYLRKICESRQMGFLQTVFHHADIHEVSGRSRVKIGSGEAHERRLCQELSPRFDEILVSTGLTPPKRTPYWGDSAVRFLGCVTIYPAPKDIALKALWADAALSGWSDHSEGLQECYEAIDAGAQILEVHVQLPDQARPAKTFEKTVADMKQLREYADQAPQRFLGRWQHA